MTNRVSTAAAYHQAIINISTGKLEHAYYNKDRCFLYSHEVEDLDVERDGDGNIILVRGPMVDIGSYAWGDAGDSKTPTSEV